MNDSAESSNNLKTLLLLVLTALLSSHALDLGQLIVVGWDVLVQGEDPQDKFVVEGGLLVAGVGLVILSYMGARNALKGGSPKEVNAVLASLVTGLIGLTFSIISKTSADNGVPTEDTARGLVFVVVGGCILLPPYLAQPSTAEGFRRATGTLYRVCLACLIALAFGALIHIGYEAFAHWCTGDCAATLETKYLKVGNTSFFVSAPSAGAFAAGMAVLATDPMRHRSYWPQFAPGHKFLWLLVMILIGVALSVLYALGTYYPKHGEILFDDGTNGSGWMRQVPGAEMDRRDTVLMIMALQIPALLAAIAALWLSPAVPRTVAQTARDLGLLGLAALIGGAGAWFVTIHIQGTGQLIGKELFFIGGHAAAAIAIVLGAWASRGRFTY